MEIFWNVYQLLSQAERRRGRFILGMMVLGVLIETFSIGLVVPLMLLMTQNSSSSKYKFLMSKLPESVQSLDQKDILLYVMVSMVFIYIAKTFYLLFLGWVQTSFVFDAQVRVSSELLSHYLSIPYKFHLQRNSAQLIHNTTIGVNLFAGAMLHGLIVVTEGLVLLALFVMLLSFEPTGTLAVVAILGSTGILLYGGTKRKLSAWGEHYHIHEGKRIQHIQQGLGGIKEILLLGRASSFVASYDKHSKTAARMAKYQAVLQNVPRLGLETLAVISLSALVAILVWRGQELSAIVTTLGLFSSAAFRLIPSANRVLSSLQSLAYHNAAVATLIEEFSAKNSKRELVQPQAHSSSKVQSNFERIDVEQLSFGYEGSHHLAVEKLTFSIDRGSSIALIGTSGSGKSTTVDLLLGLLQPTSGAIKVDGVNIRDNIQAWQSKIGYVPQTIFLTDDTLRQNVAFGIPPDEIDNDAVIQALKAAQLYDFAQQLPGGLENEVGERGVRLSGGQRQRIGIARALYHNPQILVLDEATSALDTETEDEVMRAIQSLRGEKTIILIAHRMSTVAHCDMLYRLDKGCIVEKGLPSELLKQT